MLISKSSLCLGFASCLAMLSLSGCFGGKEKPEDIPNPTDATIAPDAANGPDEPATEEPTPNLGPDDAASEDAARPANIASLGKAAASPELDPEASPAPVAVTKVEAPKAAAPAAATTTAVAAAPVAPVAKDSTPADADHEYLWSFGDKVSVRSTPARDSKEVGTLAYGERVEVLGRTHGYVKIGEGRYVMQRLLTDRKAHFYRHPTHEAAH